MIAKIYSVANFGLVSQIVQVETDISNSLPGITIVGLPDKAVEEARERIRSAIKNSGYHLPPKRFIISLVPANLPKSGSCYDLPIALSLLIASKQIKPLDEKAIFFGELGLDGDIRPSQGALIACQLAAESGFDSFYAGGNSAYLASNCPNITTYQPKTLKQLLTHLNNEEKLICLPPARPKPSYPSTTVDMGEIYGQETAKRAMLIATAGGHNILLAGPPGSGKTMLASAAAALLPPPSYQEMIEISKIHSLHSTKEQFITTRPFRSPHHTASQVAIVGGGSWPKPGEISLAHRGILFLDELAEFPRAVLEILRQPLENGTVSVARANAHHDFPAQIMLIAAQNPCPCGYAGDTQRDCVCTLAQISKYKNKLSGPLLDRIDMFLDVPRVDHEKLLGRSAGVSSKQMRRQVVTVRRLQASRFAESKIYLNSQMANRQLEDCCSLTKPIRDLAKLAMNQLKLSARAYHRVLKVSRTIADLDQSANIEREHFTEALQYRSS